MSQRKVINPYEGPLISVEIEEEKIKHKKGEKKPHFHSCHSVEKGPSLEHLFSDPEIRQKQLHTFISNLMVTWEEAERKGENTRKRRKEFAKGVKRLMQVSVNTVTEMAQFLKNFPMFHDTFTLTHKEEWEMEALFLRPRTEKDEKEEMHIRFNNGTMKIYLKYLPSSQ